MSRLGGCTLLTVVVLIGCDRASSVTQTTQPATRPSTPVRVVSEQDVLVLAEVELRKQFAVEYDRHGPYVAVHVPNSDVWDVKPAIGSKPGSPFMKVVDDGEKLSILESGVTK